MTRSDLALACAVAALAAATAPFAWAAQRPTAEFVVTGPAGVTRVPVGADQRLVVEGRCGRVVVRVSGGGAWVESADCPDQVCVRAGRIAGGALVCAPNGVVVRSEGGDPDGLDARSR